MNIFKKYNIIILFKIILYEIKYVVKTLDFPLIDLKQKNKKYHLSISLNFFFMKKIGELIKKKDSIFIDFGCGNNRVIKYLYNNQIVKYVYGIEIKKKYVYNLPKKKNFYSVNENLYYFSKYNKVFNLINTKKINQIYIFFYNPFHLDMVIKIINIFKKYKSVKIFLVGFNDKELLKIKNRCNIRLVLSLYNNKLTKYTNVL